MGLGKNICEVNRWQLWKSKINNLDATHFIKTSELLPNSVFLDVRTEQEWQGQPVSFHNTVQLNYLGPRFLEEFETLNPRYAYFVFCRTGRRSIRVCALLHNSGFREIYNLEGGLLALNALK
jgi:rhodanese-related sulfurtransferase